MRVSPGAAYIRRFDQKLLSAAVAQSGSLVFGAAVQRCPGHGSAGAHHTLGSGETDPAARRIHELRVNVFGRKVAVVAR